MTDQNEPDLATKADYLIDRLKKSEAPLSKEIGSVLEAQKRQIDDLERIIAEGDHADVYRKLGLAEMALKPYYEQIEKLPAGTGLAVTEDMAHLLNAHAAYLTLTNGQEPTWLYRPHRKAIIGFAAVHYDGQIYVETISRHDRGAMEKWLAAYGEYTVNPGMGDFTVRDAFMRLAGPHNIRILDVRISLR